MKTVIVAGAGRMGSALLNGWLKKLKTQAQFIAIDPYQQPTLDKSPDDPSFKEFYTYCRSSADIPAETAVDVIVLATKPDAIANTIASVKTLIGPNTVLVSVAAGVATETMMSLASGRPATVRVMPNIGAMVGHSVTAGYASENVTETQKAMVFDLFSSVGVFSWLKTEDELHAVTALSGSGPAYYFAICEAMAQASENLGLSRETARTLAIGTVIAAGRLLEQTPDPEVLRKVVTSPNGTTAAGLGTFSEGDALEKLVGKALSAASTRSVELS